MRRARRPTGVLGLEGIRDWPDHQLGDQLFRQLARTQQPSDLGAEVRVEHSCDGGERGPLEPVAHGSASPPLEAAADAHGSARAPQSPAADGEGPEATMPNERMRPLQAVASITRRRRALTAAGPSAHPSASRALVRASVVGRRLVGLGLRLDRILLGSGLIRLLVVHSAGLVVVMHSSGTDTNRGHPAAADPSSSSEHCASFDRY